MVGVFYIGGQDRYLGLPSVIHRSKKTTFKFILDKVSKKLAHWKRSLLSASGKKVLKKAIRTVMPIYTLSCFKLPDSLLDDIHKLMMQFWWVKKAMKRCLRLAGIPYVEAKKREAWGLKTLKPSILRYWQNSVGGLYLKNILYFTMFQKAGVLSMVLLWKLP